MKDLDPPLNPLAEARHRAKVYIAGEDGCWQWTGAINSRGYGIQRIADRNWLATHVALSLAGRPRPSDDSHALHSCPSKRCVNPEHLRWGSHGDNMVDASALNRHRVPRPGNQKRLTERDVAEIRATPKGTRGLAERLGVTTSHIANIRAYRKCCGWGRDKGSIAMLDPRG